MLKIRFRKYDFFTVITILDILYEVIIKFLDVFTEDEESLVPSIISQIFAVVLMYILVGIIRKHDHESD